MDDLKEYDIPYRWHTFEEYFRILEHVRPAINFVTLTGHGNIRGSVMGFKDRSPTKDELKKMKTLLRDSLMQGSIGLSTGLIYPPGIYSSTEELIELVAYGIQEARTLEVPFIYTSHMRSEGDGLVESVEELIRIAGVSGSPAHISHLKTAGKENWPKIDKVLSMINDALLKGLRISADRYPYTASSTDLDSILPSWVFEGGKQSVIKRLKNPEIAKKIKQEIASISPQKIVISSVENSQNRWMEGKSLEEISKILNLEIPELVINLLIEENLRVSAIFHSMSEENLERFLKEPYMSIGTDSASRSFDGLTAKGKPHPRGFGSMPRFLGHYVREKRLMSLEEAIRRLTGLPAQIFRIKDRGIIKNNAFADIVIFDPQKIKDRADFGAPFIKPDGIEHVIVNGQFAIKNGEFTGIRNGRVLRHG